MVANIPNSLPFLQPQPGDDSLYSLRQNILAMYNFLAKAINGIDFSVGPVPVPPDAAVGTLIANSCVLAGSPGIVSWNAYYTTSGTWRRIATGPAAALVLSGGTFQFYSALNAGAGTTPSWVNTATLDSAGNLTIAGTLTQNA